MDLSTREGRREQGRLIQEALKTAGLSVEELANRIGCSRALLYQYLSGATLAQPDRLQQIAAHLNMPFAAFYGASAAAPVAEGRQGAGTVRAQESIGERIRQMEGLAQAQESPPDWLGLASTCERIISLAAQAGDRGAEARALARLGRARMHRGEFDGAVESLKRAVSLQEATGGESECAQTRLALGEALVATGRAQEARELLGLLATDARPDVRCTAAILLASVYEGIGNSQQARQWCERAGAAAKEAQGPPKARECEQQADAARARLCLAQGDFDSASKLAGLCLESAESLGDSAAYLDARLCLGICAYYQGRWAEAYQGLSSAAGLARFLGDRRREALLRAYFAMVAAALCDCDNCIEQAKEALAAALSQSDRHSERVAHLALADAYTSTSREREARYHADQALGAASALGLRLEEIVARLRVARLCLGARALEEARTITERALGEAKSFGAQHIEALALLLRARVSLETGDAPATEHDASAAASLAGALGMAPTQWLAEGLLARAYAAGDPPLRQKAFDLTGAAIARIESVRADVRQAGIADTLLEERERRDIYLLRARLLASLGRKKEAVEFVDRSDSPALRAEYGE